MERSKIHVRCSTKGCGRLFEAGSRAAKYCEECKTKRNRRMCRDRYRSKNSINGKFVNMKSLKLLKVISSVEEVAEFIDGINKKYFICVYLKKGAKK